MRKLVHNWTPTVLVLFLTIKFLQFLKIFGLRAKEDGWRKITQVYLRTEQSKFALACFGLALSSRQEVIRALDEFFRQHPVTHWQVAWGRFCAKRAVKESVDIVEAEFNPDGALAKITPFFDAPREELNKAFIEIYNITRNLDDKKRSLILKKKLYNRISGASDRSYLEKILSGIFIHFEELGPGQNYDRFSPPDFIKHKHPGHGVFNIICRLSPGGEADLWFQCHHVCIDGLPMQEGLLDLKAKYAKDKDVVFPVSTYKKDIVPELCSSRNGKNSIYCLNHLVDFRHFVDAAHQVNHEHIEHEKKCITTFRLLLWRLGNHPVFRDKKFLIPVNLPQRHNRERSLGFVLIRPGLFFDKNNPEQAFLRFQDEFDRQVKLTITRRSENYELFETYASLPPIFYTLVSKCLGSAARELAGSIGVSILDRADFFVAPSSDIHSDGFIAIGNFFKMTEDKNIACPVSIKGPKDKVLGYLSAIEEIAAQE
ncbi:MAG: hypothetical protein NT033_01320 [Candidatus Omnitrophica bacterium]|nr:hypothetical protein [Candidatus Omnitrophota bacterium]